MPTKKWIDKIEMYNETRPTKNRSINQFIVGFAVGTCITLAMLLGIDMLCQYGLIECLRD